MLEIKSIVFGKKVLIECCPSFIELAKESLELYSSYESGEADVIIKIASENSEEEALLSNNPSIYQQYKDGFSADFGAIKTRYKFEANKIIIFCEIQKISFLRACLEKVVSMEYPTAVERFEQILHELVLVPMTYFFADCVPIHASAISRGDNTYLIAGTGGVGKSSATLAFRELENAKFIADDIAILNKEGFVFGNMAWPKIYGYNCVGTDLKDFVLSGRPWHDRLHYKIKSSQGLNKVRRKVKPNEFFPDYNASSSKVNKVFLLFRENVKDFKINEMSAEQAINSFKLIMRSEYGILHKFLNWAEYNSYNLDLENSISMDSIEYRWENILKAAFKDIELYKLSVPLNVEHAYYKKNIVGILEGNLIRVPASKITS